MGSKLRDVYVNCPMVELKWLRSNDFIVRLTRSIAEGAVQVGIFCRKDPLVEH